MLGLALGLGKSHSRLRLVIDPKLFSCFQQRLTQGTARSYVHIPIPHP